MSIFQTILVFWSLVLVSKAQQGACIFDPYAYAITENVCLPFDYLKGQLPWMPTKVEVFFLIHAIPSINDNSKSISLQLSLYIKWWDHRIRINMTDYSSFEDIDAEYLDLLWQPDLKIANLVDFEIQEVLKPLKGFTVFGSGLVYHSLDATATISCGMEFSRYPMDSQVCEFMVMSSNYDFPKLQFISQYKFSDTDHRKSDTTAYTIKMEELEMNPNLTTSENMTAYVGFKVALQRRSMPYIMQYYLPAIAIVILSQMSFLISPQQLPGRVALLVTLFLVLTNIFINQQASTPPSKKVTLLGEYLLAYIFFVFAALLEFALVLKYKRRADLKMSVLPVNIKEDTVVKQEWSDKLRTWNDVTDKLNVIKTNKRKKNVDPERFSSKVDSIAQVLFAVAVILYNCVYFTKSLA